MQVSSWASQGDLVLLQGSSHPLPPDSLSVRLGMLLNICKWQDSESGWRNVFFLSAAVNMFGLIFYLIFGQAEIQSWAKERTLTRLWGCRVGDQPKCWPLTYFAYHHSFFVLTTIDTALLYSGWVLAFSKDLQKQIPGYPPEWVSLWWNPGATKF